MKAAQNINTAAEASSVPAGSPAARPDGLQYEDLVAGIYCGAHEVPPWHGFLKLIQDHIGVSTATLVLRQPSDEDGGAMISVGTNKACENRYRTTDFRDDPFLSIPTDYLFTLSDVISEEALKKTVYYRELLNDSNVGIEQMLAVDIDVPAYGVAKVRLSRRQGMPTFSVAEKSLFARLIPHLKEALGHYSRTTVLKIENKVYSRALNQLLVGAIILDNQNDIICINDVAEGIVRNSGVVRVSDRKLAVQSEDGKDDWQEMLARVRSGFDAGAVEDIGAMRLEFTEKGERRLLQFLVRPFLLPDYDFSATNVGLAVFISDGAMRHILSREVIAQLFGLTRAESLLVLELCEGKAVGQAAHALNISTNTARSQLRSVYEKTGAHRMSELIGLILQSTANLG